MRAGFESARVVRRTVRRHGKRRVIRRRIPELESVARVEPGRHVRARGRPWIATGRAYPALKSTCTRPLPSAPTSRRRARTGPDGRFVYEVTGGTSRMPRFAFPGSPLVLPAERAVRVDVPAQTSLRSTGSEWLNGEAVKFTGRLKTTPAPPGGKLVELQARLSDHWQTFRTTRTDQAGRWVIRYRFKHTRGSQRSAFAPGYRARRAIRSPRGSRPLAVSVRGVMARRGRTRSTRTRRDPPPRHGPQKRALAKENACITNSVIA